MRSTFLCGLTARTGAFSALHAKTWCADGEVYFGGSFNFSRNAAANNEEHLIALRDPGAVRVHEGWFQDLWNKADVLTVEEASALLVKQKATKEAKKLSRNPSVHRQPRPEGSGAILDGGTTAADDMSALPAVSESPLAPPGRSSGAANESIS